MNETTPSASTTPPGSTPHSAATNRTGQTTAAAAEPWTDRPARSNHGLRAVVLGAVLAVLAPLFGFLGGTMAGAPTDTAAVDPIYLWLWAGLVLGGVGAVVAFVGGLRLLRANRGR
ncbi:hypothetical protein ACFSBG_09920 [Georgenia yuyongxinii]|uniref:hypothetical protein n=1 Tax=Georgenia yuyongxinii TaxID=2589797 RepID=UPI001CB757E0|nr:hypothetical protein [Georgenia yuyongxinii]